MTWTLVILLGLGAYAFKFIGLVVVGQRELPDTMHRCLTLIPAALVAALIAKDTLASGQELVIDERLPGVLAAILAAWRGLPVIAVIVIGATVTALLRQLS